MNMSGSDAGIAAITGHLVARAAEYFAELQHQAVVVDYIGSRQHRFSRIHRFVLRSQCSRRELIVKIPIDPRRKRHAGQSAGMNSSADRPRLAPILDATDEARLEYAALHGIQQHFERLEDPRFGTVRVLGLLPGDGGIVVAAVSCPTLRHVLSDPRRWQVGHPADRLPTWLRNAGAWLAEYHRIPLRSDVPVCRQHYDEFVKSSLAFIEYLARAGHSDPCLQHAASAIQTFPAQAIACSPLGLRHGDYAPHNIFAGAGGSVTVFDSLSSLAVPIHEDISYMLYMLKAGRWELPAAGRHLVGVRSAQFEREFLAGYFSGGDIPWPCLRLFEIQTVLDKWASAVHSWQRSAGPRRGLKRIRLAVQNHRFRNYLNWLIRAVNGEDRKC